jgi:hypothetical protein
MFFMNIDWSLYIYTRGCVCVCHIISYVLMQWDEYEFINQSIPINKQILHKKLTVNTFPGVISLLEFSSAPYQNVRPYPM